MATIATPSAMTVDEATAFAASRRWCRRGHRGFYYACAFLPPAKRDATYALRALVELIEQAIVVAPSDADAAPAPPATVGISCCGTSGLDQRLDLVRRRVGELYAGAIELPRPALRSPEQQILLAASGAIRRYEVPRQCWEALIDGCAAEVCTARFATRASLQRFLRHRAGSVGRAIASVLGATHSDAASGAEELAMAMRFTDLLCGLSRDWRQGKLYLPLEDLAGAGYSERTLAGGVVNDSFRKLLAGQIEQAREWFRHGTMMIPWLADDGSRLTAAALAVTSSSRLKAIERADYKILGEPPRLTWRDRARLLPAAWRLSRHRADEPPPAML